MNRVFTFGCSFTKYVWPTWANILSVSPNIDLQNWGSIGQGNDFIHKRVIECNAINKFTPDDTVIILWSEHLRFDLLDIEYKWKSERIFDNENWNHTLGYYKSIINIISTIEFLKQNGVKFYMSSILPLEINEKNLFSDLKEQSLYIEYPDLDIFKGFTEIDNWFPGFEGGVFDYFHDSKEKYKVFIDDEYFTNKYKRNVVVDRHFIPNNHYKWLEKSGLLDLLNISSDDRKLMKNAAASYNKDLMGFESFREILLHFRPLHKDFYSITTI